MSEKENVQEWWRGGSCIHRLTSPAKCLRLGCNHERKRHEGRYAMTSQPCADCTCSNFSTKVVDRRGLGPQYPRHDPAARCKPRIPLPTDANTDQPTQKVTDGRAVDEPSKRATETSEEKG